MKELQMKTFNIVLLILFAAAAFVSAQTAKEARVIGIIDLNSQSENVIETPKSIKAGKDFEVKILTAGGGCEREGETSVIMEEASASIFVYDFTSATAPGTVCTQIFKRLSHTATLNFKNPGEITIRLWGRRIGSDTPPGGEPMILEKKVKVE
jgi:hypothetical protein